MGRFDGMKWMKLAACRNMDPELFFTGSPSLEVRETCMRCPARNACLEYALDNRIEHGFWGGRTEAERKRIRYRKRWQPECPDCTLSVVTWDVKRQLYTCNKCFRTMSARINAHKKDKNAD